MPHTLAQKILQAHTDEEVREAGQIVNCHLSGVLANDITGPLAIKSFRAMGAAKVFDKDRVFLVMDHFTPQKDIDSANQVMVTRKFAQEMDVTHYYEGGDCGVEHAPIAILGAGMKAVIAHSFARIFYRNAFNMGLLLLEIGDDVNKIKDGDKLEVSPEEGVIKNLTTGETIKVPALSPVMQNLIDKGGLVNYVREEIEAEGK